MRKYIDTEYSNKDGYWCRGRCTRCNEPMRWVGKLGDKPACKACGKRDKWALVFHRAETTNIKGLAVYVHRKTKRLKMVHYITDKFGSMVGTKTFDTEDKAPEMIAEVQRFLP